MLSVEQVQVRMCGFIIPAYAKKLMASQSIDECHVISSQLISDIGHHLGLKDYALSASVEFKESECLAGVRRFYSEHQRLERSLWY